MEGGGRGSRIEEGVKEEDKIETATNEDQYFLIQVITEKTK